MQRVLFAGALGAVVLSMGVVRQSSLEDRLARLEVAERAAPTREEALRERIEELRAELGRMSDELAAAREGADVRAGLDEQIASVGAALGDALALLEVQQERLGTVRSTVEELRGQAATEERLEALEEGLEARWSGLSEAVEATALLAEDTRAQVERQVTSPTERWDRTLGPTVQLAGDTTVGSGVLLESREVEGGEYETLVLTCWHVVRDIQADAGSDDAPVPVAIYSPDGSRQHTTATVLGKNVDIDACLLRLDVATQVEHGAWLPSRGRLARSEVYDPVVAVGCPLGNDPIPTFGNVSDLHHEVGGSPFWMISAPTYIGNSGGGIFDAQDHVLLGVFSKIYTHGSLRPVIVPHMGLATPLRDVYDWLEREQLAEVVELTNGRAELRAH